jgi:hypothetical protein
MQARIGYLSKQFVHAKVRFRTSSLKALRRLAKLLKHAQCVQLPSFSSART